MPYPFTYPFAYDPYRIDLSDSVAVSDSLSKTIELVKTDSVSISDAISKTIHLVKVDSISITDVISKTIYRFLSDSIAISDTITQIKKWAYRRVADFTGRNLS